VIRTVVSIFVWGVTALALTVMQPVLAVLWLVTRPFDPKQRIVGRAFRNIGRVTILCNPYWNFHLDRGAAALYREPSVVVSNHESEADIFLSCLLPWNLKYLAKAEIYRTPIMGWGMRMAGDIGVVRGDRRSGVKALIECRKKLKAGISVIIFPEGTRSRTDEMLPFKDGAFRLAIDAQVPIQPVALAGTRYALPPDSLLFGPAKAVIRILEPVPTVGLTSADAPALTERVREQIAQARGELRQQLGIT
jgi:1-acyl-sn-glycerol-3-phosphate acyltransferase